MDLCKEYKRIEYQLMDYCLLEQRIQTLMNEAKRDSMLEIAMGLRPSDGSVINAPHMSRPKVQKGGGTVFGFGYNLDRACKAIENKNTQASEELAACLEKQTNTLLMVNAANLAQREKWYVELHYYQGLAVKVVGSTGNMNLSKSTLGNLRLSILEKIHNSQVKRADNCAKLG